MNYLHIELPSLHLLWEKNGESRVCSVIRTNYPKPSLLHVSALMRSAYADVKVIDMKIRNQDCIIPYREFTYEGGKMIASRMGMPFESVIEEIKWAEVIGLSINPTSWANIAIDFIKFAKKTNPKVKIWIGGTDAMARHQFYLENGADLIILGEAENLVADLVKHDYNSCYLSSKEKNRALRNLFTPSTGLCCPLNWQTFWDNVKINKNCNIDHFPIPAIDLCHDDIPLWNTPIEGNLPTGAKAPIAFLFATRGCNNACDFCNTPIKYGKLRIRNLESIRRELEFLKSFGIKTICLWDDSLGSLVRINRKDYLIKLVKMIRKMGFSFEFSQGISPKDLFDQKRQEPDYKLIAELFKHEIIDGNFVGCTGEYVPFEFLQVEKTETAAVKLLPYEKEIAVTKAILEQGVKWLTFSCIIGRPGDGPAEMQLATSRILEIKQMTESYGCEVLPTLFIYSLFPGTRLWEITRPNLLPYHVNDYPELYQLNATPHGTYFFTADELMDEKTKMEKAILRPDQCEKWWKSGRYQW
ncbi:MAG: cobalamin-dependent protein [Patescibacteria group bacterium]